MCWVAPGYLQDEGEVVGSLVLAVEEMAWGLLVALIELQLLDDVGVFEEPQKDLLRDVGGGEECHL